MFYHLYIVFQDLLRKRKHLDPVKTDKNIVSCAVRSETRFIKCNTCPPAVYPTGFCGGRYNIKVSIRHRTFWTTTTRKNKAGDNWNVIALRESIQQNYSFRRCWNDFVIDFILNEFSSGLYFISIFLLLLLLFFFNYLMLIVIYLLQK